MTLGNIIAQYRKKMNITQETLAKQLGVTNQAVSKWESDQCCPDVLLLPKLADIFGITLDELFGREAPQTEESDSPDFTDIAADELTSQREVPEEEQRTEEKKSGFEKIFGISLRDLHARANQQKWTPPDPEWPDDGALRIVAYMGRKVVESVRDLETLTFRYEGAALDIHSRISVVCGDVEGSVDAGRDVNCGNVQGDVDAGRDVNCGNVEGDVDAGTSVSCGNVEGDVDAGSHVGCGQVRGSVSAGAGVKCGDVFGNVEAGGSVDCTNVDGDVEAGGSVRIRK